MTIDELRNAVRQLLNDAVRGGLEIDDVIEAIEQELHPEMETE